RAVNRRDPLPDDALGGPRPRPGPAAGGGRAVRRVPRRTCVLRLRLWPVSVPGPAAEVLAAVRGPPPAAQGRFHGGRAGPGALPLGRQPGPRPRVRHASAELGLVVHRPPLTRVPIP